MTWKPIDDGDGQMIAKEIVAKLVIEYGDDPFVAEGYGAGDFLRREIEAAVTGIIARLDAAEARVRRLEKRIESLREELTCYCNCPSMGPACDACTVLAVDSHLDGLR